LNVIPFVRCGVLCSSLEGAERAIGSAVHSKLIGSVCATAEEETPKAIAIAMALQSFTPLIPARKVVMASPPSGLVAAHPAARKTKAGSPYPGKIFRRPGCLGETL